MHVLILYVHTLQGVGVDELVRRGMMAHLKSGPVFWVDSADKQPCLGTAGEGVSLSVIKLTCWVCGTYNPRQLWGGPVFWVDSADKQPCLGTAGEGAACMPSTNPHIKTKSSIFRSPIYLARPAESAGPASKIRHLKIDGWSFCEGWWFLCLRRVGCRLN
jgi:hypothetical protein